MTSPPITEREFASLIKEHSRIINKVSYFYATEQMPFEDLRQEIYANIWIGLNQFRGESRISTWIYRIAVNSALMAIRSTRSKVETVPIDFGLPDVSSELDDLQKENLQTLNILISRLENIEKAIILLWLDEYSYDDIAETLGLNRNTVEPKFTELRKNFLNRYNMQLDELKKTMSTLEQVLAKTNTDIRIDVSASRTAQKKILGKFKQAAIMLFVIACIMIAATIANINVESFPNSLKIYLTVILTVSSIWFGFMYSRLRNMNVASLAPAALFAGTARLKLFLIVGEVCLTVALAVFFALCLPYTWEFNRLAFWLVVIAMPIAVGYDIFRWWPKFIKLFRELNSIEE